jgi:hypothetical protein
VPSLLSCHLEAAAHSQPNLWLPGTHPKPNDGNEAGGVAGRRLAARSLALGDSSDGRARQQFSRGNGGNEKQVGTGRCRATRTRASSPVRSPASKGRGSERDRSLAAVVMAGGGRAGSIPGVEIVEPTGNPKHTWLRWLGLQEPPLEPDSWVPVARGFDPDDLKTDSSEMASRLVGLLSGAGIQAHQRSYEFDATRFAGAALVGASAGGMEKRVAVLVHNRDRARATEITAEFEHELVRQRLARELELASTGDSE